MQNGKSIINYPLLICILLSAAVHGAVLYSRGLSYTPPKPKQQTGQTVVQLTLAPSIATVPPQEPFVPEPEPPMEEPVEAEPEPIEPAPDPEPAKPIPVPQPTAQPAPDPVAEPPTDLTKQVAEPSPPEPSETADATPSIDQIGSTITDKGVIAEAVAVKGIQATYPRSAQRRGQEGTVLLSIQVLTSGKAGRVQILESSGHKSLDSAAEKASKKAKYVPATKNGRTIESELIQPVTFKLTGD